MRYLSMFSGIEAASVAWKPLGWEAAAFCEIEPFPCAVLSHHFPEVPNLGDVTKADFDGIGEIDLAVFGSPCQSFSVAGKRLGMDDPRGNLALVSAGIIHDKRPRWFVFENVPGLLSSDDGRDFGTLLAAFAGYTNGSFFTPSVDGWGNAGVIRERGPQGYGLAWRILDAQYFGVPQRRRRVFVIGYLGDWRRAAAVLFERHSLQGNPPPSREAGSSVTGTLAGVSQGGGWRVGADEAVAGQLVAGTLNANGKAAGSATQQDAECGLLLVANPLRAQAQSSHREDSDTYIPVQQAFGGNNCSGPIDVATACNASGTASGRQDFETETFVVTAPVAPAITSNPYGDHEGREGLLIASLSKDYGADASEDIAPTLRAMGHSGSHANAGGQLAVCIQGTQDPDIAVEMAHTLGRNQVQENAVCIPLDMRNASRSATMTNNRTNGSSGGAPGTGVGEDGDPSPTVAASHTPAVCITGEIAHTLKAEGFDGSEDGSGRGAPIVTAPSSFTGGVRRLTPLECERLQGFPDNWTQVPYRGRHSADGPRYKALGNSMAVPCMAWISHRIDMVERLFCQRGAAE